MIDLRSDTVTQPTEAMLDAMRSATFGDDSRDGDATVQKLEALAAGNTGKEAGAFLPSGTMSNLVAMLAHGSRGGEVLVEEGSHTLNAELGGISSVAGLFYRGVPGRRGAMDLDMLREAVRPTTRNQMGTALIWLENTHNRAGGAVLPLAHMQSAYELAREHGVPVHLDGARIFNAAAALGTTAKEVARHADSVCFCLSKGLSAPVGSVLCGSSAFIERARAFRRMVGGNMRQAGPIAAAGIVALENMVERLPEDHRTAKRFATGLHAIDASIVDPATVETNLVRVSVRASGRKAAEWSAQMKQRGVLVSPCATWDLRFVTHRHIGDAEVDQAIRAFADAWKQFGTADKRR
ncbi:MAG: aminotransferase class I/II-fold pyridoxal phosphate-dependent enzyme [Betaproteobacteria bacterium]|nr:aminotransferase class I/II-fold pyridoxal phosphate-dependent enzyme [Betaproteobacteria bacterium]